MTGERPLEAALGHRFGDRSLLRAALIHRSYTAEHEDAESNERLEFLGDAILQMVITDHLYERYPQMPEGEMAKVRAALVSGDELAAIATRLGLGDHLLLGRGEEATGGREKDSILADAMEAVLAAVYLDAGLEQVRTVILDLWRGRVAVRARSPGRMDYKTRLQEVLAPVGQRPAYEVDDEGPDHEKQFSAMVAVGGRVIGRGVGRSKKEAEQQAAREALAQLEEGGD